MMPVVLVTSVGFEISLQGTWQGCGLGSVDPGAAG